jgi:hypothetical protein
MRSRCWGQAQQSMCCQRGMRRAFWRAPSAVCCSRRCRARHPSLCLWPSAVRTSSPVGHSRTLVNPQCCACVFLHVCHHATGALRQHPIVSWRAELINAASGADRLFQTPIPVRISHDYWERNTSRGSGHPPAVRSACMHVTCAPE